MTAQETLDARPTVVAEVAEILDVDRVTTERIVASFEACVVDPIIQRVRKISPKDVARRNPYAYAARGITSIEEWTHRAADDIEASSLEGLVGTWLEEVAIIVSGGFKPGGGVDLQIERNDGEGPVVELYALQSTTNTKNAGGRRSDDAGLEASAQVLRAGRRYVVLFRGYLYGRRRTTVADGITRLATPELWERLSGQADFEHRLYRATATMSALVADRIGRDRAALVEAVAERYGDGEGAIDPATLPL